MTNSNAVNETEIMKKITLLTLIIITILAATGCRRSKSNGKIDGFWGFCLKFIVPIAMFFILLVQLDIFFSFGWF